MDVSRCKVCNSECYKCHVESDEMHLHQNIEDLKETIIQKDNQIIAMETALLNNSSNELNNVAISVLKDQLKHWQDKFSRLYDAQKKLLKVNQSLEEKLLKLVDRTEGEKNILMKDITILNDKLVDSTNFIRKLQENNEKYKNDVNLAVHLLKCKPVNSVPEKYELKQLPRGLQETISSYIGFSSNPSRRAQNNNNINASTTNNNVNCVHNLNNSSKSEKNHVQVPIVTYPPTAMVYSMSKLSLDNKRHLESVMIKKEIISENNEISTSDLIRILEHRNQNNQSPETETVAVQTDESISNMMDYTSSLSKNFCDMGVNERGHKSIRSDSMIPTGTKDSFEDDVVESSRD